MLRTVILSGTLIACCLMGGSASAKEIYFRTPSENIYCAYMDFDGAPFIRCDIRDYTPSFKHPADCELDYGSAFQITTRARRGEVLCAGDTVMFPDAEEVGYGDSFAEGGLSCDIEKTGVTCTNAKGHGFFLSKAKQKVF